MQLLGALQITNIWDLVPSHPNSVLPTGLAGINLCECPGTKFVALKLLTHSQGKQKSPRFLLQHKPSDFTNWRKTHPQNKTHNREGFTKSQTCSLAWGGTNSFAIHPAHQILWETTPECPNMAKASWKYSLKKLKKRLTEELVTLRSQHRRSLPPPSECVKSACGYSVLDNVHLSRTKYEISKLDLWIPVEALI